MKNVQKEFGAIKKGDLRAFERVFRHFYDQMFYTSLRIVMQREVAEEIVQDLFIHLWQNRRSLMITTSPEAYLHTAIRNRSFNYLKSRMARPSGDLPIEEAYGSAIPAENQLEEQQLSELIHRGIKSLPEKCRLIFNLSREMGLSYEEIARELGISRETVKSQIKIALQKLREFLEKHWDMLVLFGLLFPPGTQQTLFLFNFF